MTSTVANRQDEVAAQIAIYTADVSDALDATTERAARAVLTDSLAVAMGALAHPAAQAARRHAYRFPPGEGGCAIWGSPRRSTPEIAALANGVLLRLQRFLRRPAQQRASERHDRGRHRGG
jgi:2-methylcitrate dehydratase